MSLPVIITPQAQRELVRLEDYLADRFSAANAEKYISRLVDACKAIGLAPYRGTKRDDLRPGLRVVGFERSIAISFEIRAKEVFILAIRYRGRSLP